MNEERALLLPSRLAREKVWPTDPVSRGEPDHGCVAARPKSANGLSLRQVKDLRSAVARYRTRAGQVNVCGNAAFRMRSWPSTRLAFGMPYGGHVIGESARMFIAMNRFKVIKGEEADFEELWLSPRVAPRHGARLRRVPHAARAGPGGPRALFLPYGLGQPAALRRTGRIPSSSGPLTVAPGGTKPMYLGHPGIRGLRGDPDRQRAEAWPSDGGLNASLNRRLLKWRDRALKQAHGVRSRCGCPKQEPSQRRSAPALARPPVFSCSIPGLAA